MLAVEEAGISSGNGGLGGCGGGRASVVTQSGYYGRACCGRGGGRFRRIRGLLWAGASVEHEVPCYQMESGTSFGLHAKPTETLEPLWEKVLLEMN